MTNREKFAEEILDIACSGSMIAKNKFTGELVPCMVMCCENCEFSLGALLSCGREIKDWANAEYIERFEISKKDREFLEYIPREYKTIVRNKCGNLYVCKDIPDKDLNANTWFSAEDRIFITKMNINFPMIKWEDEEPWSIEELKKLEVVDEYEDN